MENITEETTIRKSNDNVNSNLLSKSAIKSHKEQESKTEYSNLLDADVEPKTFLKPKEIFDELYKKSIEKEDIPTNADQCEHEGGLHENYKVLPSFSSDEQCTETCKERDISDNVKPKKLPKVLSKLCLGPVDDESLLIPQTSLQSKQVDNDVSRGNSQENLEIENKKDMKKNIRNKIEENFNCCEQPILSKELAKNKPLNKNDDMTYLPSEKATESKIKEQISIETECQNRERQSTQSENGKSMDSKFTLTRTPRMLKKIFLTKSDDTMAHSKSKQDFLYNESNLRSRRTSIIKKEYFDIDESVELRRKPYRGLKHTLRESFRKSFRVKRTQSEPPKEKNFEAKPRRSSTFKMFSKALLPVAAIKMQPPAPLLVEDPPSSDDVSDLEDVKHFADPALLNGSSGNFGSAGARSAPSTPQGVLCPSPGGLTEPLSQPCSPGCTSPSIQRSPSHSVFTKCEKASLKHLSTSTPVMTAQAQLTEPPSPKATKDPKVHTTSKARQKKFLRHFPNVEDDEKVLNHYSCALIGDILLQGHLYITKNYFAFYSNVFGYVTKLLIPILTVENITKEKTARIIPNAVGIATSEDKHVFGSLMSRDNTLQYMRTVWQKAKSASPVIIEPEITEQDLDSSESGEGESGRDSPPPEIKPRFSLVKKLEKEPLPNQTEGLLYERKGSKGLVITLKETISEFRKLPRQSLILFATTLLLILLFLSAAVLLYRISKIQNKYSLALQDNVVVSGSEDVYSDLLHWQTQLHSKSAGAVHSFLDSNLDQIAKVRQSLEALSSLLIQNSNPLAQDSNAKPLEATKDAS